MFKSLWKFLGENSTQVSALSSFMFGISSAVVAWVALRLSFVNNFGWKPLVLLTTWGRDDDEDDKSSDAEWIGCSYEVWNRQKYPIVIRE